MKLDKYASLAQISKLDEIAMSEAGLDILQMMEIAGNKFAIAVKNYLKDLNGKKILVLAGTGHNGGDGLSAARYLNNWGAIVRIVLAKKTLKEATAHHLKIIEKMGLTIDIATSKLPDCDLIIDSLLGYNQSGDPKPPYNLLINLANRTNAPVFSFDNPSGLNIETGRPSNPTIKATSTITLAVIKKGLIVKSARDYVGEMYLIDLGIPRWAYEKSDLFYPFDKQKDNHII